MRVTLIHNPKAGHASPSDDDLVELLEDAGHEVVHQSIKKKKWKKALDEPGELVVVAGGDGTVGKVAVELVGKEVPLAILPLGTANNVATGLGIGGTLEEIVAAWAGARRRGFDIGVVSGPWGETWFLESVGFGLFTHSMALVETNEELCGPDDRDEELQRDLGFLRMTLDATRSHRHEVVLDGEDLSGEYFLLEAMNTPCIGPNLCLAPGARPGDGLLHLVMLGESERDRFAAYLDGCLDGDGGEPRLPVRTGRSLRIRWQGLPLRIDSQVIADPSKNGDPAVVEVRLGGQVELLLGSG